MNLGPSGAGVWKQVIGEHTSPTTETFLLSVMAVVAPSHCAINIPLATRQAQGDAVAQWLTLESHITWV